MIVSIIKGFNKVIENQPISVILEQIKGGSFRAEVESLRKLLKSGDQKEYDKQKKSLLAFTPLGTFSGGRKQEFLKEYSGLIILDFDKLPADQIASLFERISLIPYTYSLFKSPSGNGL